MKVFSNTTPLIALASVGLLELLPRLFGKIHVTTEVIEECAVGGPILVPDLRQLDWIVSHHAPETRAPHILLELDKGEKSTLLAALSVQADLVLIDEKLGRNMAEYLGLKVAGTLGVLLKARKSGLIDSFGAAAVSMREQGIYYDSALLARLAKTVGE